MFAGGIGRDQRLRRLHVSRTGGRRGTRLLGREVSARAQGAADAVAGRPGSASGAAKMAWADAGLSDGRRIVATWDPDRVGVVLGSCVTAPTVQESNMWCRVLDEGVTPEKADENPCGPRGARRTRAPRRSRRRSARGAGRIRSMSPAPRGRRRSGWRHGRSAGGRRR